MASIADYFSVNDTFEKKFEVSVEIYESFIKTFNDDNRLHVDSEYAIEKGFKEKVIHGNILNGFISYFIGKCLPIDNVILLSQTIQYKNPVYLGDTLILKSEISVISTATNFAEFKFKFIKKNEIVVAKGKVQIKTI